MKKYCQIDPNGCPHIEMLINWLIEEVKSSGGDGDGIWYSQIFDVQDIKEFILLNNLLPDRWAFQDISELNTISVGEGQEGLIITNNVSVYNSRPFWQQVTIAW